MQGLRPFIAIARRDYDGPRSRQGPASMPDDLHRLNKAIAIAKSNEWRRDAIDAAR